MQQVVVMPARDKPIPNFVVVLICKCGAPSDAHPTDRCSSFSGKSIIPVI